MVELVTACNRHTHERLLEKMYEDRKAVFIDLLKWDIPHDSRWERDQFDDSAADYLIVTEAGTSDHLASLRLLRTDRPHILNSLFAQLCDGPVPSGPGIREISRMCLSPRHRGPERLVYRNLLASAMTEYALLMGIHAYTGVAEIGWLSRVLSAGWRCQPLGMPRTIGGTTLGALLINIDADTIRRLQASGKYHSGVLRIAERESMAA